MRRESCCDNISSSRSETMMNSFDVDIELGFCSSVDSWSSDAERENFLIFKMSGLQSIGKVAAYRLCHYYCY